MIAWPLAGPGAVPLWAGADIALPDERLALGALDYLVKSRTTPVQLSTKVRGLLGGDLAD